MTQVFSVKLQRIFLQCTGSLTRQQYRPPSGSAAAEGNTDLECGWNIDFRQIRNVGISISQQMVGLESRSVDVCVGDRLGMSEYRPRGCECYGLARAQRGLECRSIIYLIEHPKI